MEKAPISKVNQARRVEVVGSNPAGPTTRRTDPAQAKIFNTIWALDGRKVRAKSKTFIQWLRERV